MNFSWYGLLVGVGASVGLWVAFWYAERQKISEKLVIGVSIWTMLCALIGARVYHLATDWELYQGLGVSAWIAVWNGGLGVYGALIGAVVGLVLSLVITKRARLLREFLNMIALAFPIGQAIGRWGNLVNGEIRGVSSRWIGEHPIFLYESVLNVMLWIALLFRAKKNDKNVFFWYIGGYGLIRFFLEPLRESFLPVFWSLSLAQWISIGFVLVSLFAVQRRWMRVVLLFLLVCVSVWMHTISRFRDIQSVPLRASLGVVTFSEKTFRVEVADTDERRALGLGGRNSIGEVAGADGMLFFFSPASQPTFWMKGMRFPIDILWISENAVIKIDRNLQPEPNQSTSALSRYSPPRPVEYVLELQANDADRWQIDVGDSVQITLP
ncbi:MAG: Prolipoprotein diacylglyceryl transferase [Microgenomates group bacterium GW2011_GWF2_45_18]|nr:MAG: Prolipoprotein diacylglyceryl transferase [Microgenomates group bacterium GW2011_GWF1_44_10]KKU01697.1 MAG: Prolipoprotein diacylglyceryl transferase [Microgenomates group bacterium GW2011_GWF2_45_18]HAU99552.1 hypothetical protein [Candidatus Paceibacterota bacterium]HAX01476.1 hypothetical protein [Candidatus Paceibacterota bacterium]